MLLGQQRSHPSGTRSTQGTALPGTALALPAGTRGQLRGAVPRAVEQPALGPRTPAAPGQCLHSHTAEGWKDGPMETAPSCNKQTGGTPTFILLPLLYETHISL